MRALVPEGEIRDRKTFAAGCAGMDVVFHNVAHNPLANDKAGAELLLLLTGDWRGRLAGLLVHCAYLACRDLRGYCSAG
jgi:hypothetical protein